MDKICPFCKKNNLKKLDKVPNEVAQKIAQKMPEGTLVEGWYYCSKCKEYIAIAACHLKP